MTMTRTRSLALAAAALALMLGASTAEAHRHYFGPRPYHHPGSLVLLAPGYWYAGAGVLGTSILAQSGGPEVIESGAGLDLFVGLTVNKRLSLELGWMGSMHNPVSTYDPYDDTDYLVLQGVTADARIHLDRSGSFDPYLQGGVGFYALGRESVGIDSTGTGFQLGGGFDLWLGDAVTVGLRARYHGIAMGPAEGGSDDTFISALTVEGSVGLHF
jgi:opacity protein-like surface antigen